MFRDPRSTKKETRKFQWITKSLRPALNFPKRDERKRKKKKNTSSSSPLNTFDTDFVFFYLRISVAFHQSALNCSFFFLFSFPFSFSFALCFRYISCLLKWMYTICNHIDTKDPLSVVRVCFKRFVTFTILRAKLNPCTCTQLDWWSVWFSSKCADVFFSLSNFSFRYFFSIPDSI